MPPNGRTRWEEIDVCITVPADRETPEEMAARIRGLQTHVDQLATAAGVLAAGAAQKLTAELDYIAGRVERGLAGPAWRRTAPKGEV